MSIFKQGVSHLLRAQKPKEKTAALILAAGNSTRMGGKTSKQFMELCGIPVLAYTLLSYQACPLINEIIVAARKEDFEQIATIRREYGISKLHTVISGGKDRQASARRAFSKISADISYVAIADGARCLTTRDEIESVCLAAYRHRAASAAQRVVGTVKRTTKKGAVKETVSRENLWEAQTPQVFHVALYAAALKKAEKEGRSETDDNALIEQLGCKVQLVECSKENIKITTPEDLRLATAIISMRVAEMEGSI